MFLLLPLLLVGGLLYAATRNHPRAQSAQLALPAPTVSAGDNSPLAVLAGFCREGQTPPPILIQCAIAQAESLGRFDLRDHIVRTWILPVVEANQPAMQTPPPQQQVPADPPPPAPQAAPAAQQGPLVRNDGQAVMVTDEQAAIDAALAQMAAAAGVPAPQQTQGNAPVISAGEIDMAMHAAPPRAPSRGAPRSPIGGVDRSAWSEFVDQVMREEPTFSSARHVGQFRHRRDRLAELGINPDRVIGDPRAQTAALESDMADAYRHASASGMVDQFIGCGIELPDGSTAEVSLSGMLGVIQAAGLDGAFAWLEDPADRIRFPHTTMAFVRTNGVF